MHHYPEGVERPRFWQKACPEHRPDWLPTAPVWSHDKQADIHYCVVNELAALLWAVNLGSIELRTGRVLVDWSQNTEHKSMVCAYSVRAKQRPTVSSPVGWDEVESAVDATARVATVA
jgi:DNA primase